MHKIRHKRLSSQWANFVSWWNMTEFPHLAEFQQLVLSSLILPLAQISNDLSWNWTQHWTQKFPQSARSGISNTLSFSTHKNIHIYISISNIYRVKRWRFNSLRVSIWSLNLSTNLFLFILKSVPRFDLTRPLVCKETLSIL